MLSAGDICCMLSRTVEILLKKNLKERLGAGDHGEHLKYNLNVKTTLYAQMN